MAFLDNSGDIILDAVLTDLGRKRLAQSRFQISKFALGDEEINYKLFNKEDPRGSAFYDLEVLQTPILEAFTSDQSLMKSKLMTLATDTILFLPLLKVNNKYSACAPDATKKIFHLLADNTTATKNNTKNGDHKQGILHGVRNNNEADTTTHICIDQGIISLSQGFSIVDRMDPALQEKSYMIKVDERLLELDAYLQAGVYQQLTPRFIDDDGIATYYVSQAGQASAEGESAILSDRASMINRTRNTIRVDRTPAEIDQRKKL